jgi:hypothetical protein
LIFHTAGRKQFVQNKSKRYISVEIEVASMTHYAATVQAVKKTKGAIVRDGSLPVEGFEINTAPASGDLFLSNLETICEALDKGKGTVTKACGLHVHVDARDLTWYDVKKLVLLYAKIENALFSIIEPSRRQSRYCRPCGDVLVANVESNKIPKETEKNLIKNVYGSADININDVRQRKYDESRYNALNLHSWLHRGTIENRMCHGTLNFKNIANWSLIQAYMIDYAFDHSENDIKSLSGDSLSTLLAIIEDENIRKWIIKRYDRFNKNKKPKEAAGSITAESVIASQEIQNARLNNFQEGSAYSVQWTIINTDTINTANSELVLEVGERAESSEPTTGTFTIIDDVIF